MILFVYQFTNLYQIRITSGAFVLKFYVEYQKWTLHRLNISSRSNNTTVVHTTQKCLFCFEVQWHCFFFFYLKAARTLGCEIAVICSIRSSLVTKSRLPTVDSLVKSEADDMYSLISLRLEPFVLVAFLVVDLLS